MQHNITPTQYEGLQQRLHTAMRLLDEAANMIAGSYDATRIWAERKRIESLSGNLERKQP